MSGKPWEGKFRDPVRPVDFNYASMLEVLERESRPMPGAWIERKEVDARLSQAKVMLMGGHNIGPKNHDKVNIYELLCMLRHRPTGQIFAVFRESMDYLMQQQTDPVKYPEWLIKSPVKRTELRIHVAKVLRKPQDKDDWRWLEFLDEGVDANRVFDAIAWYLRTKGIIGEAMYGRA
jgi:hypothetical protein